MHYTVDALRLGAKLCPRQRGDMVTKSSALSRPRSSATQTPHYTVAAPLSRDPKPRNEDDDDGVVSLAPSFHGLRSSLLSAPVPTPDRATAASPRLPQLSPRRITRCFLRRVAGSRERVVPPVLAAGTSVGEYPRGRIAAGAYNLLLICFPLCGCAM